MNELVPQSNIHNYAVRNTSPKMPIEQKYLEAFISAIFSSPELKELYKHLQDIIWNEDSPMVFLSLWDNLGIINDSNLRPIVAYAMLKKDEKLFEMISSALFTGTFELQWDQNFVKKIVHHTDENMAEEGQEEELPHTDIDLYTDMVEGIPFLVFHNIYCDNYNNYHPTSRYQTSEELVTNIEKFKILITACKPARAEVIVLYEPYVFIHMIIPTINAGTSYVLFNNSYPTTPSGYIEYINSLTNEQLLNYYNEVKGHNNLLFNQLPSYPINITPNTAIKFNSKIFIGDSNGGIRKSIDTDNQFEYVTSLPTSINSLTIFNNQLYVSRYINRSSDFEPVLYTSSDGIKFSNPYSPLPKNTNKFFEYNNVIYAGTNSGLYICTDMFNFKLNNSIPENYAVYAFEIFNDKLYVGTNHGIYISSDNDYLQFIELSSFPQTISARALITKNNYLYVGTADDYLYVSANGFDFARNTSTPRRINDFIDYGDLYAATSFGVYVLYEHSTDNQFVRMTFTDGQVHMNNMASTWNGLFIASYESGGAKLYHSTDGVTFSIVEHANNIYALGSYDDDELYISQNISGNLGIYKTVNGQSFTMVSISTRHRLSDTNIYAKAFLNYRHRFYAAMESNGNEKFRSSFFYFDDDEHKFREKSPLPALLSGIASISTMIEYHNKLFIAISDYSSESIKENYRGIYRTSDNLVFTRISSNNGEYAKFFVINDRLFIYNMLDGLRYSTNGENFSNCSLPGIGNADIIAMHKFNNKIYASAYHKGVYISSNNGVSFTLSDMFTEYQSPDSIITINNTLYFIRNSPYSSNELFVYLSYDGQTVNQQRPNLLYHIQNSFQLDDNTILCGMRNSGLFICDNSSKPQDQYTITNKSIIQDSEGRKLKFEIMTTKDPFIWGNLTLLSGDNTQPVHLPDITISPTNVISEQKTSTKHFIIIELFFQ